MLLVIATVMVYAQSMSIHMLDSTFTQLEVNPSYRFSHKIQISLPSMYAGYYSNSLSAGDVLSDNGGINTINLSDGIQNFQPDNNLSTESNLQFIGLGINAGNWQINAGYNWRITGVVSYTEQLANLLARGNAPYIGQRIDISTPFNYQSFHEMYLGASYQLSDISLGFRVKYWSGIETVSTDRSNLYITTDDEIYALTVESDYLINTSGVLDYNGIEDIDFSSDLYSTNNIFGANRGIGFDIGFDWQLSDKISIAASVLDIGNIDWSTNVENYTSNEIGSYEGVDILDFIDDDEQIILEDSLSNLLNVQSSKKSFTTTVGSKIHLSSKYIINDRHQIGLSYGRYNYHISSRDILSIMHSSKIKDWLSGGLGFTITNNNYFAIPLNAILTLGPVKGFMTTDNIISLASIKKSKIGNVRVGVNIEL